MIIKETKKSKEKRYKKLNNILIAYRQEMDNIRDSRYGQTKTEKEKEAQRYWIKQIDKV